MSSTDPIRLTAVLGSVTAPGRLHRSVAEALARVAGADTHTPLAAGF